MKNRVLVTGASGFVGGYLVEQLLADNFAVVCTSRAPLQITGASCVQVGQLDAQTDWRACLNDVQTVVHCAARVHVMHETAAEPLQLFRQVNVAGTLALAEQAAASGVKQFIYLSSIKVNGERTYGDLAFTEESPAQASDRYSISKQEAELALMSLGERTGMAITIIRPPLVYGRGVDANFLKMLAWVKKQIPLPLASIHNQRSFVFVRNLVSLISACIDNPKAYQQIFLVSDRHDLSTPQLLREAALAIGVQSRLWPFPSSLLMLAASLLGKKSIAERLCQSLQVDSSKAQRQLGWTPPFTVQQGLQECAAGLLAKKKPS